MRESEESNKKTPVNIIFQLTALGCHPDYSEAFHSLFVDDHFWHVVLLHNLGNR